MKNGVDWDVIMQCIPQTDKKPGTYVINVAVFRDYVSGRIN